jgi:hypothetical protein
MTSIIKQHIDERRCRLMTNGSKLIFSGVVLVIAIMYPAVSFSKEKAVVIEDVRHVKVFHEVNRFAGWPAILCTHTNRWQILEPVCLDRPGTTQRLLDHAIFGSSA